MDNTPRITAVEYKDEAGLYGEQTEYAKVVMHLSRNHGEILDRQAKKFTEASDLMNKAKTLGQGAKARCLMESESEDAYKEACHMSDQIKDELMEHINGINHPICLFGSRRLFEPAQTDVGAGERFVRKIHFRFYPEWEEETMNTDHEIKYWVCEASQDSGLNI